MTADVMVTAPTRIQLRRTDGWRKPDGAVVVARPSRWGNPWRIARPREHYTDPAGTFTVVHVPRRMPWPDGTAFGGFTTRKEALAFAVDLFRRQLLASLIHDPAVRAYYLGDLVGHDLACWCPVGWPCHADVLLELANQ